MTITVYRSMSFQPLSTAPVPSLEHVRSFLLFFSFIFILTLTAQLGSLSDIQLDEGDASSDYLLELSVSVLDVYDTYSSASFDVVVRPPTITVDELLEQIESDISGKPPATIEWE